jgi:signal transduction histidine kinase
VVGWGPFLEEPGGRESEMRQTTRQLTAAAVVLGALAAGAACAPPAGFVHGGRVPAPWVLPVEVVTLEPYGAVVLPMRGSYATHDVAIARVGAYLATARARATGPAFGRYFNDPSEVSERDQLWEVGFPVDRPTPVAPPFELRHFPRELVARIVVPGPYAEGGRRWPALHAWIAASGYASSGSAMAIWTGNPALGGADGPRTELRMPVVHLSVPLLLARDLLCLFGAAVFALFTLLYVRERRARSALWGGGAWGLLGVCCACVYLQPLLRELMYLYLRSGTWLVRVELGSDVIGFVAPPLLVHLFYYRGRARLPRRRLWLAAVVLIYATDLVLMLIVALRPLALEWWARSDSLGSVFVAGAALVALSMEWIAQRAAVAGHEGEHRAYCLVLAAIALAALAGATWRGQTAEAVADLVLLGAPIVLLFVTSYHNERAAFFDVLAKAGSFLLLALILLGLYFSLIPSLLFSIRQGWLGLWLSPATALPLVLAAPWSYRRLSSLVDRLWLGRRLSPAQAGQQFFASLRGAASEAELLRRAEEGLSEIFQAPARVALDAGAAVSRLDEGADLRAAVREGGITAATISVDARAGRRQLLSEDRALLDSLAQGLSVMLDNVHLHERKLAQETKERELQLHASRSELRALRAQINPHFLFNALNTIAALIPRDPPRAEESVERLAEVFRYTLRSSELEWVRVSEEMIFVRAYLELELTRFGARLTVATDVEPAAARALVPAMVVQTLVENAVKHGIGTRRGQGKVEVAVRCDEGRLRIEVRDSGPGFSLAASDTLPPSPRGAGHGLHNVRERLRGYFADDAAITAGRDPARGMACVSVSLPLLHEAPGEEGRRS